MGNFPGTEGTDYQCTFGCVSEACSDVAADPEDWSMKHDPQLQSIAYISLPEDLTAPDVVYTDSNGNQQTERPTYTGPMSLACPVDCWYIDVHAEIGEAVGGIFAAMGLVIVMVILFVAAAILFCVACCCC